MGKIAYYFSKKKKKKKNDRVYCVVHLSYFVQSIILRYLKKKNGGGRFRSADLWIMTPVPYRQATRAKCHFAHDKI